MKMWKYKDITRENFEKRKDYVEQILIELGAISINYNCITRVFSLGTEFSESIISDQTIYQYEDAYFRVDEVLFSDKPYIVIEWADNLEIVLNNTMEDTEPFPYDLSDEEILDEVRRNSK